MPSFQKKLTEHLAVLAVPHDLLIIGPVIYDDQHAKQAPLATILLGLNDLLMPVNDTLHGGEIEVFKERRLLFQVNPLVLLQIFLDGTPCTGICESCRTEDVYALEGATVMIDADVLECDTFSRAAGAHTDPPQRRSREMLEATPGGVPIDAL